MTETYRTTVTAAASVQWSVHISSATSCEAPA